MTNDRKNWLDKELSHWVDRGWITKEAQQHIRSRYGIHSNGRTVMSVPLYLVMSVIGLAVFALAMIWVAAFGWYHINVSIKLALAVIMLVLSQASVGTVLFQQRQGTLLSEGIGLVHCAIVFISLALVEQAFYTGWDMSAYLLACVLLLLPSAYLLQSIGAITWYYVAALVWASTAGVVNVPGGVGLIWLLLAITVPFYAMLVREKSDFRLAVFSWVVTIGVFGAFGFSVRSAGFVPFLMLSALAAVMLLTGYSIDIRKAWGVPFRWFGRLAAAGALVFSCMASSWLKIVQGNEVHWLSIFITIALFVLMVVIFVKWLKKRLWSPLIYSLIPVLLGMESLFVHNGSQPSVAILMSTMYAAFLGFFEIGHGFRNNNSQHIKWGVLVLFCLVASFFIGYQISPVIPVLGIIFLCLIIWKAMDYLKKRNVSMLQRARNIKRRQSNRTVTAVRSEHIARAPQPAGEKDELPEWMREQPERVDKPAKPARKAHRRKPEPVATPEAALPSSTVVTKPVQESLFVPPVFHEPDEMPLPQTTAAIKKEQRKEKAGNSSQPERITSSPWSDMPERPKREKHFTHSPWSQEGESKK